jgi:LuxR family maltose regulon positive regulatory protein
MTGLLDATTLPHLPVNFVSRPRLLALLRSEVAARAVVLRAAAGFGKTALLVDWARASGNAAWLRPRAPGPTAVREQVVSALDTSPHLTHLVLDDADELDATTLGDLTDLVRHRRPGVRFVLAGRRLDVRGAGVSTVEAEQLAFTSGEASALMAAWGVVLDAQRLQRLRERVGGRAAGLRLAALCLRRGDDPEQLLGAIGDVDGGSAGHQGTWVLDPELVQMLSSHRSLVQIADRLCVPVPVARGRMHATYAALGASSRRSAVLAAQERGFLR